MADRNIRALIADDEPLARANLRVLVSGRPGWCVVGEIGSGSAVIDACARCSPDVLFLDVRMPGLDGVEAARLLAALTAPPLVVFVTAYSQHALEAFEVAAVDYLVKPPEQSRFERALQRVERLVAAQQSQAKAPPPTPSSTTDEQRPGQLIVRSLTRTRFVPIADLVWIASEGNYVRLYLPNQCLLHRCTLTALERDLDPDRFIRIHRSAMVNRHAILEVRTPSPGRHLVVLSDGAEVEISQRSSPRVLEALGIRSSRPTDR